MAASAPSTSPDTAAARKRKIRFAIEEGELETAPTFDVEYPVDARKLDIIQKNPLVPIGAVTTAAVLMGGLFAFKRGSQAWSQRLMRARVLAQGATLVVLAHSVYDRAVDTLGTPTDEKPTPVSPQE